MAEALAKQYQRERVKEAPSETEVSKWTGAMQGSPLWVRQSDNSTGLTWTTSNTQTSNYYNAAQVLGSSVSQG